MALDRLYNQQKAGMTLSSTLFQCSTHSFPGAYLDRLYSEDRGGLLLAKLSEVGGDLHFKT